MSPETASTTTASNVFAPAAASIEGVGAT